MKPKYGAVMPLIFILIALLLNGCTTGSGPVQPTKPPKYELTLSGTLDGSAFTGIAVGSAAKSHRITISSSVDVNLFTVKTCHRSIKFEDVIATNWITPNRSYSWTYNQAPTIEDTGECIARFCAFSKEVGSQPSSCAVIDFKSDRYQLPGENICNGDDGQTSGTALCHTQVGLVERFRFKVPVLVAPPKTDPTGQAPPSLLPGECQGKFIDEAQTIWEYQVPTDECVVVFMERGPPYRRAKLSVIPYNQTQYSGAH